MKDANAPRNGFIITEETEVAFFSNDYVFTFFDKEFLYDYMKNVKPNVDGFVNGRTTMGLPISLYTGGNGIRLYGSTSIKISAYAVGKYNFFKDDIHDIGAIEFIGGTLNHLFSRESCKLDVTEEGHFVVKERDNRIEYNFTIGSQKCRIAVYNSVSYGNGTYGVNIKDNGVKLKLFFDEGQSLKQVLNHVDIIKRLLSFMTGCTNVGFDEIKLWKYNNGKRFFDSFAQLFIKQDYNLEKVSAHSCITFEDLGICLPSALELFYINSDKRPSYVLGFLLPSKTNLFNVTNSMIKEICSSLECELSFINDLMDEEQERLNALVEDVKKVVKQHRRSNDSLSPKTYDMIFGSIRNWSMSASDKILLLYERYANEMQRLNPLNIEIGRVEINEFVKFRNDVTHGSYRVMDGKIELTAYILSGLVYCCLLNRIGISKEEISKLFESNKILAY